MSHIAEAAEAIHALINSTPRTPSQAEIAAVIDKALTTPSAARGATRSMTRSTTTSPTSDAICAELVWTLEDLVVRAAIAAHWSSFNASNPDPDGCTERYALGAVVRGVLDLAGLRFDAEGRLL